jgi:hypothetical protein
MSPQLRTSSTYKPLNESSFANSVITPRHSAIARTISALPILLRKVCAAFASLTSAVK